MSPLSMACIAWAPSALASSGSSSSALLASGLASAAAGGALAARFAELPYLACIRSMTRSASSGAPRACTGRFASSLRPAERERERARARSLQPPPRLPRPWEVSAPPPLSGRPPAAAGSPLEASPPSEACRAVCWARICARFRHPRPPSPTQTLLGSLPADSGVGRLDSSPRRNGLYSRSLTLCLSGSGFSFCPLDLSVPRLLKKSPSPAEESGTIHSEWPASPLAFPASLASAPGALEPWAPA
mmetsp:Transcript_63828/g.197660  ORF Transcript_63828/g.197660 Transcript_63828/m.197660 type:complete len:245 (-) Transcript_63828:174-908(-)